MGRYYQGTNKKENKNVGFLIERRGEGNGEDGLKTFCPEFTIKFQNIIILWKVWRDGIRYDRIDELLKFSNSSSPFLPNSVFRISQFFDHI